MLLSDADREVNGVLQAAKNKEPYTFVIAAILALYVIFVIVRIIQNRVRRHSTPAKRRFFIAPGDVLPIITATIATCVLIAIVLKLLA